MTVGYGWPQFCNEKGTTVAQILPQQSGKHDGANLKGICSIVKENAEQTIRKWKLLSKSSW